MSRLESQDNQTKIISVVNYAKSIVPMSDYEANMIADAMRVVDQPIASSKLIISSNIDTLLVAKSNINYLILKIKDYRRESKIAHDNEYHQQFTLLTKMGRPSNEAKIAEMYFNSPTLQINRDKLSDVENLLEFLESFKGLIDSNIRNMDSRRYDL